MELDSTPLLPSANLFWHATPGQNIPIFIVHVSYGDIGEPIEHSRVDATELPAKN